MRRSTRAIRWETDLRILLIAYDNDSHIHWFPIGLGYLASALRDAGHQVEIYSQDQYHWPEEHLTNFLDENDFDMVGVGVCGGYYQYRKLLAISSAIRATRRWSFYVLGGHGPSPEPEFFLRKTRADAVVIGEGEETIVELANAVENGGHLDKIKGLAYWKMGAVKVGEPRPQIEDVDSLPYPAWNLFPMDYYALLRVVGAENGDRVFPVLSSRGCPYRCNFCYRLHKGFRLRSVNAIMDEISHLREKYHATFIVFADELLMSSCSRAIEIAEALRQGHPGLKWSCNGRLNFATPKVLAAMKEAGCVEINYGVECFDDRVLAKMNKRLTTAQIVEGVTATWAAGIIPTLNFIFGSIGETAATLRKSVDFLLTYDGAATLRTIRPVTPYPGSDLYYYAIKRGLLKGPEDFYERAHVNSDLRSVNFTDLSDAEYDKALLEANKLLIEEHFRRVKARCKKDLVKLYDDRNGSFRGFRQT